MCLHNADTYAVLIGPLCFDKAFPDKECGDRQLNPGVLTACSSI